ncbi:MAG: glycosyltransferase family 2 protein [Angelakisella sp.]|nr:glycosyltransferase family 2 protein [Angelakisella sp.]MCI9529221.1 glycosyltransferase family 2 protein [Angelakisella sp.]
MEQGDKLYIVVPCYNEEEVLPETVARLTQKLHQLSEANRIAPGSRMLLVDDGSRDRTWEMIREYHQSNPLVEGLKLARNRGHQNALLAGLMAAKERCDLTVSMDADLQDDIDAIDGMLEKYREGCDVVYGVRSSRETDTAFKRGTALAFYRLMNAMGAETVYNHADYRLMSRRALEGLSQFREVNLFLRGLVPMVGYRTATVEYRRGERFAGESKYPLTKMLNFAVDGITSLSVRPIRVMALAGAVLFAGGCLWLAVLLALWLLGRQVTAAAVIVASVWGAAGLQLLGLGVIGEYLGKIYLETKARPRYLVETELTQEDR